MGIAKNEMLEARDAKRSKAARKKEGRLSAFSNGDAAGEASWADCSPDLVHEVVDRITSLGGAVTFGMSRDQGAHSLTLMLDDGRKTKWFPSSADLDDGLRTVVGMLAALE